MYYKFDCGCKFKQYSESVKECDGLPPISIDYYNLPECPKVWSILGSGKTKGIFQLEQNLGKKWCKELYPENINHIAALGAILRPGVLESFVDGKSITQHYCDNKNHKQEYKAFHPALEKILEDTYSCLIYQEQILLIAKELAGFNGVQADTLRRGIGHKDPALVFSMEQSFIEGCEKVGIVNQDDAKMIFDIIKKSNRYLFNFSHSAEYGLLGYATAYVKSHFPLHFFAAYLATAKDKQDPKREIKELVEDARSNNINISPPHITSLKNNPFGDVIIQNKEILFGIIDIKGIGRKQIHNIYEDIQEKEKILNKDVQNWSWKEFLFNIECNSTVMNNLILVGATPGGEPRKQKSFEYSILQKLTDRELGWLKENYSKYSNLGECLKKYSSVDRKNGGPSNYKRKELVDGYAQSLENSPFSTKDHPDWIVNNERELIGIPITYSSTENKKITTDMTCDDFLNGKRGKVKILVEIASIREYTIKNGQNAGMVMAFVELSDSTNNISGVLFSEAYKDNQEFLFEGNVVIVEGYRSKKDQNSLVITRMEQA